MTPWQSSQKRIWEEGLVVSIAGWWGLAWGRADGKEDFQSLV
jgi:hypothetical protein